MKFNKLFKILLVLIVLLVFLNAVAASNEMDSFGVGAEDGNLAVENNDVSDTLSAGNSWYVKAGSTNGDGSQENPYANLKSVTNNANYAENDIIYVMDGTYSGQNNRGIDLKENTTVMAYEGAKPIFNAQKVDSIFVLSKDGVVLKGLTLINGGGYYGTTAQGASKWCGGAIFNSGNNLVVDNCTIKNGDKLAYGSGIYSKGKNTEIKNCYFTDNTAQYGGAVAIDGPNARLINNNFYKNYGQYGGAINIYNYGGAIIANNTFERNYANYGNGNGYAGAIYARAGNNLIKNNTFDRNSANSYGGAICLVNPDTVVDNCTFKNNQIFNDNTGSNLGGAIYTQAPSNITNSKFIDNAVRDNGGAIFVKGSDNFIENCTFDKNWAARGGAIYIAEFVSNKNITNPVINNCTFNENGVDESKGGAIYSYAINTTVTNSKFNNNKAMLGGAIVYQNGRNFLENDTFVENIAGRYGGGAISSTKQGDTINNCTFIKNHAKGYGGAIGADYPTITNSKFIENTAFHGGAICTIIANVSNSEFYDNSADDGWYIVAATELIEDNNIHPEQNSISLHDAKYMDMSYDPENGITHVDGYTAFCVEEDADVPKYGVLWKDLRFLQNSLSEEYVGEYLKILIFKYWNDESDYASFVNLINIFTDHDFKSSNNAIVNDVISLYDSGFRVPTNGALKLNDDGTAVVYNFGEIIVPSSTQNVFVFTVNKTNLTVEKEVLTNPVVIGKHVDFNITVKNTGECNLTSVWINETGFSNGLVYDSFRSPFNWTYDATKNLWILNETLEIGKTAFVILTFNVTDSGIMENNVSVGFSNHTFGNDTVIFPVYIPNMTVEKVSLTPEVTVGMPAFFMIRINNTGECELSNINVTEMNSQGLSYQDFSDSTGKWIFIGTMDKPKWQYNGTLQVGESAEIMVIYNTLKAGTFTNVVAVDNNQTEGSGKNDTVIHEPMLSVVKITMTPKVAVGELTSFLIRVTNTGDCDLDDVYVKELKFDGLVYDHFTSVSGRWSFDGKNKWTYDGILAEGERSQFTVFFKTIKVGNFTNIVVAGSNLTNETTAENVTETFENKTDNNNTNNSNDSNNTNRKNDTNTTSHVPKDLKETDVNLKRATGNPLFALLAVLLLLSVSGIRKFKK